MYLWEWECECECMFLQDFLNGISLYLTLSSCHPLFPGADVDCYSTYTIPVVVLGHQK